MTAYFLQKISNYLESEDAVRSESATGGKNSLAPFWYPPVRYEAGAAEFYDYSQFGDDPLKNWSRNGAADPVDGGPRGHHARTDCWRISTTWKMNFGPAARLGHSRLRSRGKGSDHAPRILSLRLSGGRS